MKVTRFHYNDVIIGAMASQITSLTFVCWTVYSGADQRKHQSTASLAFVLGIHRWPMNSPHKWPVRRKMFPFDDVIMLGLNWILTYREKIWRCFTTPGEIIVYENRHCLIFVPQQEVTQWYHHVSCFNVISDIKGLWSSQYLPAALDTGNNHATRYGLVFWVLLGVSSDYAQPITGQVTEVTCPVIGLAQPELTPSMRRKRTLVCSGHYSISGHKTYLSVLIMELYHNHPIVRSVVENLIFDSLLRMRDRGANLDINDVTERGQYSNFSS